MGIYHKSLQFFRKLSVEDNIMAVLELNHNLNEDQRNHKLEGLLAEFNIEHIRHIEGLSLSGGERRRAEIARSLAMEPRFIYLMSLLLE